MDGLPSFHLTQPSAPEVKRWEVQCDMLPADFPGSSRILSLAGAPSGGSTPVCGGMGEGQAKHSIHPTGSHSAPNDSTWAEQRAADAD